MPGTYIIERLNAVESFGREARVRRARSLILGATGFDGVQPFDYVGAWHPPYQGARRSSTRGRAILLEPLANVNETAATMKDLKEASDEFRDLVDVRPWFK